MTSVDDHKLTESANTDHQPEITAALVEMYNRKAVELPRDPWMKPREGAQPAIEAIEETYGN